MTKKTNHLELCKAGVYGKVDVQKRPFPHKDADDSVSCTKPALSSGKTIQHGLMPVFLSTHTVGVNIAVNE